MGLFFDDTPDYKNPIVCIYDKGLLGTRIFVDSDTRVMYFGYYSADGMGLTVMLGENGTPKLFDGDLSKFKE